MSEAAAAAKSEGAPQRTKYIPTTRTFALLELNETDATFRYVHNCKARLGQGVNGTFVAQNNGDTILTPTAVGPHAAYPLEACTPLKVSKGGTLTRRGKVVLAVVVPAGEHWMNPGYEE